MIAFPRRDSRGFDPDDRLPWSGTDIEWRDAMVDKLVENFTDFRLELGFEFREAEPTLLHFPKQRV